MSCLQLKNGVEIPLYGLGLSHNGGYNHEAVLHSLSLGVKLYDTATRYGIFIFILMLHSPIPFLLGTESHLGLAINASSVSRQHIFVSSKLWPDHAVDTKSACKASLDRLQLVTSSLSSCDVW